MFPDQQKSNISSLFLALYFQESGERQGQDRAFEFSHKSFGEYLLSRRILGCLRELHDRLNSGAWNAEYASKRWCELFGPTSIQDELIHFISDSIESMAIPVEILNAWRKTIIDILVYSIKRGLPMNQLGLSAFQEMDRYNKNSILSLLILHSVCYRLGQPVIPIEWAGQKLHLELLFALHLGRTRHLSHWSRHLRGLDLRLANLNLASMAGATLEGANLTDADLSGSTLTCADFTSVNLSNAILGFEFKSTKLRKQIVYGIYTDLRSVNLCKTNLTNVSFDHANLLDAYIQDANLCGAKLTNQQLDETFGIPALMPDGKPPKKSWLRKRSRKLNFQDVEQSSAPY